MKGRIDRANLEAIAAHTIPMLRSLVQTRNEILTRGIDAFETAVAAASDVDGDHDAVVRVQDMLLKLLGQMTATSAEMARACVDMTAGSQLEDLVRSHLYNPMPDGTVVGYLLPDDDGNGGGAPPGSLIN